MTPLMHHTADTKWLSQNFDELIKYAGVAQAKQLSAKYSDVYLEAHEAEPCGHKKENMARRAANTKLVQALKYVRSKVTMPPIAK